MIAARCLWKPILDYCDVVWIPSSTTHFKWLGRLHARFSNLHSTTCSYSDRVTAVSCRHKTLYKLSTLYLHDSFHYAADITSCAVRNAQCLFVPIVKTVIAKKYCFRGTQIWNLLNHFMQQGNWLILNCYTNHFYVYNSCMFVRAKLKNSIFILNSLPFKK